MLHLREIYCRKLCDAEWKEVASQTRIRIEQSQMPDYNARGPDRAIGLVKWINWRPTLAEKKVRTLFKVSRP